MKKKHATINITGLGPVMLDTAARKVTLVGALTGNGEHVNTKTKKVSRNARSAKNAEGVTTAYLKDIGDDCFILVRCHF